MDNQDNVAKSFIPSAGYIDKPTNSQQNEPNKKVIIIVTAIILSVMVIFAIVFAIIVNLPKDSKEPEKPAAVEKPEQPAPRKEPEAVRAPGLEKTLATKANFILTHGSLQNASSLKYTSAPIFYTNDTISNYYRNFNETNKMMMIVNSHQASNDVPLSDKQVSSFGSESCQLLFGEKNCKLIKNNIEPNRYRIIARSKAKLEQEYAKYFQKNTKTLPKRLIDACPYFTYIKEISSYVYRNHCENANYKNSHFYQYKYAQENDYAYVYFAGAITTVNDKGRYTTLYSDLDSEKLLDNQGDYSHFKLDSKNYGTFQHYRLVFKKSGSEYVYDNFEKVDD
ncbi:hypothetical protein J6X15_00900 [Candidatus Saccharibacteria bacterium]|nr:hypothetical protein [Candidatus Saccharibacteria bacterium]